MNENELYVVLEYIYDNTLITDIGSMLDSCFKDCHHNYFHNFKSDCMYDIKLTNITKKEIINLAISGKSMMLYELNIKLKFARQNSFIFNQINKLTIKFFFRIYDI